ncbi:cell envelope biogenesis protein OmpA [Pyxidicoccus fallax]|uniref:Cell envelope biogenesis protein OmpA n=1 Tax=Pyxidicoccus fallax TaxID=394095 RepID=A0A848LQY9_9BACT|nr:substrate-binding domain-containing protein [Pyxidicoccus fallax]NMO20062.1 cell envelope biogenesis protein OmpA [Pyxidicoccus fallax]NPC80692.1 cell envelope biogenesis protein OmpA [Pyxidicoccus fallax]
MKMMKMVMSAAVVAVSVVGCGGQSADESVLGSSTAELTDGNKFFGSDTLKGAMISANTASLAGLSIEGKGSSVGEGCVRTGSGTFCSGRQQTLAPMSRDFRATASACAGGTASGGTGRDAACCPGEKSNVIALDAVNAFVNSGNGLTNISRDDLANLFFASYRRTVGGVVTNYTGACWTDWSQVPGSTRSGAIKVYRRDDLSGTTEVFKEKVAENTSAAFCPGVIVITDGAATNPAPCTASDSATTCIGKLTAADVNAIGFAGDSGKATGNVALSVNAIAPTITNVRKLITDPANAYPLARQIFLNENVNFAKDPKEQTLFDWIYSNKSSFQNILVNQGFIACSSTGPLRCGGAANDGRGAGLCKGL